MWMEKGEVETPSARVFIVEDDQLLAMALSAQVETMGYRVAGTAGTAEEAVRGVLELRPQVVIMDMQLAGWGTGLDAARSIRRNLEVPIVFYTAHGNDHALKHEVACMGRARLLHKPAREQVLMAALSGVLGRA
jgi:DNA-binding NarL/FixJ family response regulator